MSVMKRLFYWQPRFCPGSRSAVCNIPCVLRHPDGTRRGWPPLTHLHEASTGGQLCGTWLCLPMGIKKDRRDSFQRQSLFFFSSDSGRFRRLSGSGSSCRTEEARFLLQQAFDKLHTVHMVRARLHKLFQLAHPLKTKSGVPGRAALSPEPGCSSSHSSI